MPSINVNTSLEVIECFKNKYIYDSNGLIFNKKSKSYITSTDKDGYISHLTIWHGNIRYSWKSHRFIYYLLYNDLLLENEQIDHIDGNKSNNLCHNLRKCSHLENSRNLRTSSKSGYKGVRYNGKFYDSAARYYFNEFAHCNFQEILIMPKPINELKDLARLEYRRKGKR